MCSICIIYTGCRNQLFWMLKLDCTRANFSLFIINKYAQLWSSCHSSHKTVCCISFNLSENEWGGKKQDKFWLNLSIFQGTCIPVQQRIFNWATAEGWATFVLSSLYTYRSSLLICRFFAHRFTSQQVKNVQQRAGPELLDVTWGVFWVRLGGPQRPCVSEHLRYELEDLSSRA